MGTHYITKNNTRYKYIPQQSCYVPDIVNTDIETAKQGYEDEKERCQPKSIKPFCNMTIVSEKFGNNTLCFREIHTVCRHITDEHTFDSMGKCSFLNSGSLTRTCLCLATMNTFQNDDILKCVCNTNEKKYCFSVGMSLFDCSFLRKICHVNNVFNNKYMQVNCTMLDCIFPFEKQYFNITHDITTAMCNDSTLPSINRATERYAVPLTTTTTTTSASTSTVPLTTILKLEKSTESSSVQNTTERVDAESMTMTSPSTKTFTVSNATMPRTTNINEEKNFTNSTTSPILNRSSKILHTTAASSVLREQDTTASPINARTVKSTTVNTTTVTESSTVKYTTASESSRVNESSRSTESSRTTESSIVKSTTATEPSIAESTASASITSKTTTPKVITSKSTLTTRTFAKSKSTAPVTTIPNSVTSKLTTSKSTTPVTRAFTNAVSDSTKTTNAVPTKTTNRSTTAKIESTTLKTRTSQSTTIESTTSKPRTSQSTIVESTTPNLNTSQSTTVEFTSPKPNTSQSTAVKSKTVEPTTIKFVKPESTTPKSATTDTTEAISIFSVGIEQELSSDKTSQSSERIAKNETGLVTVGVIDNSSTIINTSHTPTKEYIPNKNTSVEPADTKPTLIDSSVGSVMPSSSELQNTTTFIFLDGSEKSTTFKFTESAISTERKQPTMGKTTITLTNKIDTALSLTKKPEVTMQSKVHNTNSILIETANKSVPESTDVSLMSMHPINVSTSKIPNTAKTNIEEILKSTITSFTPNSKEMSNTTTTTATTTTTTIIPEDTEYTTSTIFMKEVEPTNTNSNISYIDFVMYSNRSFEATIDNVSNVTTFTVTKNKETLDSKNTTKTYQPTEELIASGTALGKKTNEKQTLTNATIEAITSRSEEIVETITSPVIKEKKEFTAVSTITEKTKASTVSLSTPFRNTPVFFNKSLKPTINNPANKTSFAIKEIIEELSTISTTASYMPIKESITSKTIAPKIVGTKMEGILTSPITNSFTLNSKETPDIKASATTSTNLDSIIETRMNGEEKKSTVKRTSLSKVTTASNIDSAKSFSTIEETSKNNRINTSAKVNNLKQNNKSQTEMYNEIKRNETMKSNNMTSNETIDFIALNKTINNSSFLGSRNEISDIMKLQQEEPNTMFIYSTQSSLFFSHVLEYELYGILLIVLLVQALVLIRYKFNRSGRRYRFFH